MVIVRQGTASGDGKTLTIAVPELARTGAVQVLGSAASYQLQIVPVLRGVGGAVQSGNTIEIEVLLGHCREKLSAYKVPHSVQFIAEIPRTGSGKIIRYKLREAMKA